MTRSDDLFLRQIAVTGQLIRTIADQRLKAFDLTVEQLHLLKQLAVDQGRPQSVLGAAAAKSPANITRILDRLERKGRVVRRPNPEDRRSSLVFLTTEGARLCDEVISLFQGLRHHLMHGIGETERDTAVMVLERITTNIGRMSAQGGPQPQPSQFDPQKEYTR